MNENKNIEDFFKENFKDVNVNPNNNVWKGVKSNLWFSDIQNLFYNYTIQPANNVWRIIALKLWFKEFIVFSPKTFNVYYLSSIVIISTFLFAGLNNKLHQITTYTNNLNQVFNNKNISNKEIITYNTNNRISEHNLNYNIENNKNKINSINDNSLFVNKLNKSNNTILHSVTNNTIRKNNFEPIIDESENITNEVTTRDYSLLSFIEKQSIAFKNKFNDDSVFKNRPINEYNIKKWHWSVESYLMPLFNSSNYKINETEFSNFHKNDIGKSTNEKTLSGGILVETKHLNFSFQTGLSYTNLTDKPNYQYLSFRKDSILVTQINHGGHYNYFDVNILNLDSLLLDDDSVYFTIHDSIFIATIDTILTYQTTILKTLEHKKTYNSYSYVELPLIAGYTFSQGKISLTLRAGIIAGILTKTSGYLPSPYSEFGTINVENNSTRKIMYSGITGIEAEYDASKRISIIFSPIYRFNLSSVFKNNYIIDERFKSLGFKLDIKYKLK